MWVLIRKALRLSLRIHAYFFPALDLYDAAVMNGDLDGPELEAAERLDDLLDDGTRLAARRYGTHRWGTLGSEDVGITDSMNRANPE